MSNAHLLYFFINQDHTFLKYNTALVVGESLRVTHNSNPIKNSTRDASTFAVSPSDYNIRTTWKPKLSGTNPES